LVIKKYMFGHLV